MANFNIKEIFNSDNLSIRINKINRNFDEILANGGGPEGPKGDKGERGPMGIDGQNGTSGTSGTSGVDGQDGSSNFDTQQHSDIDQIIFKLKKYDSNNYQSSLFIGDPDYNDNNNNFGSNSKDVVNAKLVIGTESGHPYSNHLKILTPDKGSINKESLIIRGETVNSISLNSASTSPSGSIVHFQADAPSGTPNNLKLKFSTPYIEHVAKGASGNDGEYTIDSDKIFIKTGSNGKTEIQSKTTITESLEVKDKVELTGQSHILVPRGNTSNRPSTNKNGGYIRYNTDNKQFEGLENGIWKNLIYNFQHKKAYKINDPLYGINPNNTSETKNLKSYIMKWWNYNPISNNSSYNTYTKEGYTINCTGRINLDLDIPAGQASNQLLYLYGLWLAINPGLDNFDNFNIDNSFDNLVQLQINRLKIDNSVSSGNFQNFYGKLTSDGLIIVNFTYNTINNSIVDYKNSTINIGDLNNFYNFNNINIDYSFQAFTTDL